MWPAGEPKPLLAQPAKPAVLDLTVKECCASERAKCPQGLTWFGGLILQSGCFGQNSLRAFSVGPLLFLVPVFPVFIPKKKIVMKKRQWQR
ncbi:uncharacterized protein LOC144099464 isoform X2 [Amblyomma americanum]